MSSQFEGLFKAVAEKKSPAEKKKGRAKQISPTPPPVITNSPSKVLAKSKNPEFEQALFYIKTETKKEVKKLLLDDTSGMDFSDLIEQLLSDWISAQK